MSIARKNTQQTSPSDTLPKDPLHPSFSPSLPMQLTEKQLQLLTLIFNSNTLTGIYRHLNIAKQTAKERVDNLARKGLITNTYHHLKITEAGKIALQQGKVGGKVNHDKNLHRNLYSCTINEFPANLSNEQQFIKNFFQTEALHNQSSKQLIIYFQSATLIIHYSVKRIDFLIKEQTGNTFDEIKLKVWEQVVSYHQLLRNKGFNLSFTITSKNPDFANPNGFFAMLSRKKTQKGFLINTENGDFYVDYSKDDAEEETSSEEMALRMEKLAASAYQSNSDFNDLDHAVSDIDKIIKSLGMLTKVGIMDVSKHKSLLAMHENTQQQISSTLQLQVNATKQMESVLSAHGILTKQVTAIGEGVANITDLIKPLFISPAEPVEETPIGRLDYVG